MKNVACPILKMIDSDRHGSTVLLVLVMEDKATSNSCKFVTEISDWFFLMECSYLVRDDRFDGL